MVRLACLLLLVTYCLPVPSVGNKRCCVICWCSGMVPCRTLANMLMMKRDMTHCPGRVCNGSAPLSICIRVVDDFTPPCSIIIVWVLIWGKVLSNACTSCVVLAGAYLEGLDRLGRLVGTGWVRPNLVRQHRQLICSMPGGHAASRCTVPVACGSLRLSVLHGTFLALKSSSRGTCLLTSAEATDAARGL